MKTRDLFFCVILFGTTFLSGCVSESEQMKDQLIGAWELEEAFRDGEPTTTLKGSYIRFTDDGMMESNLPYTRTIRDPYKEKFIIKDKILLSPDIAAFKFKIKKLEEGKLVLTTKLAKYPFQFTFRKVGG